MVIYDDRFNNLHISVTLICFCGFSFESTILILQNTFYNSSFALNGTSGTNWDTTSHSVVIERCHSTSLTGIEKNCWTVRLVQIAT